MVVPIHTTLLPNFIWFSYFDLINTHLALIIPYVAFTLCFNTLVYMGQLRRCPDPWRSPPSWTAAPGRGSSGASWPRCACRPPSPSVVMTFLNNWNEFIMAYTYLSTDNLRTLPFSIIKFQGEYRSDYAIQFACMFLVAVRSASCLYFFFIKMDHGRRHRRRSQRLRRNAWAIADI